MRTAATLLSLLALVSGCAATASPDKVSRPSWREEKLATLEQEKLSGHYESQWRAAQLCYEMADEDQGENREKSQRKELVKRGLAHAERATKLKPELVEGHFYKLILMGRLLELSTPEPVLVADLRDQGERTARLEGATTFECDGAHRFLGVFYSECPETGPWGYGDLDKADQNFQKALASAPDCPENFLAYAEFQYGKMENAEAARELAKKALEAVETHPGLSSEQRV
ncbi:MAG: hypothetical protein ACAI25_13535, partial [Planctomycetota bacterium]